MTLADEIRKKYVEIGQLPYEDQEVAAYHTGFLAALSWVLALIGALGYD